MKTLKKMKTSCPDKKKEAVEDLQMPGWFSERCPMWPGMALSIEIESLILRKKSPFQQIEIYQTKTQGKMLVLDGIIQLTEADEFAYHEMLAHIPLFAHPSPETVLVIGGGDGGILRQLVKHECLKRIDICEIDETVIQITRKFLPEIAIGFDHHKVHLTVGDGNAFIRSKQNAYDVIIVDSSDPVGPGEVLFQKPFYRFIKSSLKQNGIVAAQGESFFMHTEFVINLVRITQELFPVQGYAYMLVPSYPGGHLGINLASKGPVVNRPARVIPEHMQKGLKYYSPKIHEASFILPNFADQLLNIPS